MTNTFGSLFGKGIFSEPPPVKKSEEVRRIHEQASLMFQEDTAERTARKSGVDYIILGPDHKSNGGWVLSLTYVAKANASPDPFSLALGGGPTNVTKYIYYKSFEQAEAWLEKNKFFGLQPTKYLDCVYASWDRAK